MSRTVNLNTDGVCGACYVGGETLNLVTGCQDGRISIRDINEAETELKGIRRVDNHPIQCVAAHPKRDQFAIGDKAGAVHVGLLARLSSFLRIEDRPCQAMTFPELTSVKIYRCSPCKARSGLRIYLGLLSLSALSLGCRYQNAQSRLKSNSVG